MAEGVEWEERCTQKFCQRIMKASSESVCMQGWHRGGATKSLSPASTGWRRWTEVICLSGCDADRQARTGKPTDLRATLSSTPHITDLRTMLSNRASQPQTATDPERNPVRDAGCSKLRELLLWDWDDGVLQPPTKQLFSRKRRSEELHANQSAAPEVVRGCAGLPRTR
eukprot:764388-Hanusia_phi.AAC.2